MADVTTQSPLSNYNVELTIDALDGTRVFAMDTRKLDYALPPITTSGTINIQIPQFFLGEGQFVFGVVISDSTGIVLAHKENALVLQVGSDAKTTGLVKAFPEVSVSAS